MLQGRWGLVVLLLMGSASFTVIYAQPVPAIEVRPSELDFGTTEIGDAVTLGLQIWNVGNADLTVQQVSSSHPFFTPSNTGPFTFGPQQFWQIQVTFRPQRGGAFRGNLRIRSNDPNQRTVLVPMQGTALVREPVLRVTPGRLDLGEVPSGETVEGRLLISNAGTAELVIQQISTTRPEWSVSGDGLPGTLQPGERTELSLVFRAINAGVHSAFLVIESNDPKRPRVQVPLQAAVLAAAIDFEVTVEPSTVFVTPGEPVAVVYRFVERAGFELTITGGDALLVLPGSKQLVPDARPVLLSLSPRETATLTDSVVLPLAYLGGEGGIVLFRRSFLGRGSDGNQAIRTIEVILQPVGSLSGQAIIHTISLDLPVEGTTAGQGEELPAHALLKGSGSGSVLGAWLLDGAVIETFQAEMDGSRVVEIAPLGTIPTGILGWHTLQLQVIQPNTISSEIVRFLVTPEPLEQIRFLTGEGFPVFAPDGDPPSFLWTIKTAVAGYKFVVINAKGEEAFSHLLLDNEWTFSLESWRKLPPGEYTVTVRPWYGGEIIGSRASASFVKRTGDMPVLEVQSEWHAEQQSYSIRWTGLQGDGVFLITWEHGGGSEPFRKLTKKKSIDLPAETASSPFQITIEALNDRHEVVARGKTKVP